MLHGGRGVQTRRMTRVHTFQSVEQMLARRALPRSTAAAGRPSPRSTTKPAGGGAQQQIIGQGASEPVEGGGEAARPGRFWPVPPTPSTSASSGSAGASASPGTVTGEAAPDAARHSSLIDMDAEGRGTKGRKVKGKMGDEVFTRQHPSQQALSYPCCPCSPCSTAGSTMTSRGQIAACCFCRKGKETTPIPCG